jgi:hypothetical protein
MCFSSYQIAASGWLTPYLADALTLVATKTKSRLLTLAHLAALSGESPEKVRALLRDPQKSSCK